MLSMSPVIYANVSQAAEGRLDQPSTHSREHHPPTTSEGTTQPNEFTNQDQQPPTINSTVTEGIEDRETSSLRHYNGDAIHGGAETTPSGSIIDQLGALPGDEWYGSSMAEAGVEEFAGLELLNIFRQGYGAFS